VVVSNSHSSSEIERLSISTFHLNLVEVAEGPKLVTSWAVEYIIRCFDFVAGRGFSGWVQTVH